MSHPVSILVIGGGASGLMAAIFAAREGAQVTLLEHEQSFGNKLLATGNGRCNLTNVQIHPDSYRGTHPEFALDVIRHFDNRQTISFFSKLGIYTKNQEGRLYPHSQQASSVRDVLHVKTVGWTYLCGRVILCTGSPASNIAGADDSGYALAQMLGHRIVKPMPALVPLRCEGNWFSSWAGVRVDGQVTLLVNEKPMVSESGELQMTKYGVSGIPIFQISRYAVRALEAGARTELEIDFLPEFENKTLASFLNMRKEQCPYKSDKELLCGLFPDRLIPILLKAGYPESLKHLRLVVQSAHSMESAQVCCGGVDVEQVDPRTMESLICPGLYFAGEILDIDGACGGYNLQFAWSTGALAGQHAAVGGQSQLSKKRQN